MFISARDQARFGLFTLRNGKWGERQLLSEEWLRMARTPTPAQAGYGFMNFFLNTGQRMIPAAPETAWSHRGNGVNMIYCDPVNDIVVVARWLRSGMEDDLVARVLAAVTGPATSSGGRDHE
jgi:CubicO group peptidase (beta-lactamase class C family)